MPFLSEAITTTFNPQIAADAGLVPCADAGINTKFLLVSPIESRYLLIASKPAYSPLAPELGWENIHHPSSDYLQFFTQFINKYLISFLL